MKKSFKLKALVLSMLVMMGLTLVPSLYAVEPFKNHDGVTEENADFVVSYMADKTTLQPGDEFTVTINVEKLPANGKGIVSLSNRIAYDSRVLEPCTFLDSRNREKVDVTPGDIGRGLNLSRGTGGIITFSNEPEYIKAVSFGAANTYDNPTEPGIYATVKFRAKTDATESDAKLMLLQDGITYNGFAIAGKTYDFDAGRYVVDTNNTFFIKSNLSDVNVSVNP